tara:strand:- start:578 stop:841 length:264 start_codon:yes stop_codon:yes gene_type:complete
MTRPTRTDYLAYAKASSEDHHMRLTNVMTQDTLFEDGLEKVESNTIYLMNVSRKDHTRSWGYLIIIKDNGEIENASDDFIDTLLEEA